MTRKHILETVLRSSDGRIGGTKHEKMLRSPFLFLRGSNPLFYRDLANQPLAVPQPLLNWPLTTIMGDCHLENFGFFTEEGSFGERLIFAPNDFDDACFGHAFWDLLRFSTSLHLVTTGHTADLANTAINTFLSAYQNQCGKIARQPVIRDTSVVDFEANHILHKVLRKAQKRLIGGSRFLDKSVLGKSCDLTQHPLTFRSIGNKFKPLSTSQKTQLSDTFSPYFDDAVIDCVERIHAGTGSIGLARFYFLIGPNNHPTPEEFGLFHIIEVRQQRAAAPLSFFDNLSNRNRRDPAHLTASCQRRMQRSPDLILDAIFWDQQHWLVRSRHHARASLDSEDLIEALPSHPQALNQYAESCGQALALAHSRGDCRSTLFEASVNDTLPHHTDWLVETATQFASQTVKDQMLLSEILKEYQ